ncbi:MAG TPA: TIGR02466 family protein [Sphingomicrobium sp.]|nr:TIGR02466 family protein [Sphingomicrobium sp.]
MSELLKLFATPVVVDEVPGAEQINAALEPAILAQRAANPGVRLSNRGGWQSKRDFPQWAGDAGRRIIEHALQLASSHTSTALGGPLRWTYDVWANANEPGGFNFPHVHGGTFWSAVYYVRVSDGNGGQLVLHDPRMPGLRMHAPNLRFKDAGEELLVKIAPSEGRMVLFPGWLSHSVEPWEGSGTRISVALNIRAVARESQHALRD